MAGMASGDDDNTSRLLQRAENVPLRALNVGCKRKIALFMDPEGALLIGKDICNDWCGLAELAGFSNQEITNLKSQRSQTMELLHLWGLRTSPVPTVKTLIEYILEIERFDVITECSDPIGM